jgi:uncharacterized membrane protein
MEHKLTSDNVHGIYDGACWHWHLKRNISMTPAQMASILGGLGLVTLVIGSAFYWAGASFILPFSLIEIAALLFAFIYTVIHANDYEKLILSDNEVKIERKIGFKTSHAQLVRSLTRIDQRLHTNELIQLRQGTRCVSFGQFVHANLRPVLSKEIAARMRLQT